MSYGLSHCGYDVRIAETFTLLPKEFRLASTVEEFRFPRDVAGLLKDKSTWARRGISVFNTVFEPGWRGNATIEIANLGAEMVHFEAGFPIAQMMFVRLEEPTDSPYVGKYQNQGAGPQAARYEQ
jgi:dCTP deaminase